MRRAEQRFLKWSTAVLALAIFAASGLQTCTVLAFSAAFAQTAPASADTKDVAAASTPSAGKIAAGGITLHIRGLRSDDGAVSVAICDNEQCYADQDGFAAHSRVAAAADGVTLHFPQLPPGLYAITMFHDENGNRAFDTNFLGLPREGFGFSNNAVPTLTKPAYARVALAVPMGGLETEIRVIYW